MQIGLLLIILYCTWNSIYLSKIFLKTKLSIFKKNKNEIIIEKTYVCDDLVMFILVSLYEILSNKYKIHKCINCGKIFINNKKDTNTRYCNYISPQDKKKTCFISPLSFLAILFIIFY